MNKNILQICNFSSAYKGNFIGSLQHLQNSLHTQGIQTIYLFPSSNHHSWRKDLEDQGAHVYIQKKSLIENIFLIAKIIHKHKVGVIMQHFADLKVDIILSTFFRRIPTMKFVHNDYRPSPSSKTYRLIKILFPKSPRCTLIGVSSAVTESLRVYFPHHHIRTVPNGICFDRLNVIDPFEKDEDILRFMCMGYSVKIKGLDLSLQAIQRIQAHRPAQLWVVGVRETVEQHVKDCLNVSQIPSWVRILAPTENIGTYYKNCDIFLAASRSEGFSYALVEAAWCKTQLVASDIPAHKEHEIPNLFLFRSEDLDDYVRVIETAITTLEDKQTDLQAEQRKQHVENKYPISLWTKLVIDALPSSIQTM